MSKPNFTPGPWSTGFVDGTKIVRESDRSQIAQVAGDYSDPTIWPIMEANAHLIAAAPDLYALAELFAKQIEYEIKRDIADGDDEGARMKATTLNRLVLPALSKARGEA